MAASVAAAPRLSSLVQLLGRWTLLGAVSNEVLVLDGVRAVALRCGAANAQGGARARGVTRGALSGYLIICL